MNCERTLQALPWYLNGSLSDEEKGAIDAHLAQCESCRRELAATREAGRVYRQHIPTEALVAHAFGEETELPASLIEAHVASCDSCRDELAMVKESRAVLEVGELDEAPATGAVDPPRQANVLPGPWSRSGWQVATLAAALVAAIGLSGWAWNRIESAEDTRQAAQRAQSAERRIEQLEAQIESMREPAEGNPSAERIAELEAELDQLRSLAAAGESATSRVTELERQMAALRTPRLGTWIPLRSDSTFRGDEGASANEVEAGTRQWFLVRPARLPSQVAARLIDETGAPIWQADLAVNAGANELMLDLPPNTLPLGTSRLELLDAASGEPLASYTLKGR